MKTTTSVCICLTGLFFGGLTHGQNRYTLPQVTPQSPNAASLGKYGDVPVSLSNGMANVGVPLLNVQAGSVAISINLSYHNNGLKPDEIPSWAGAWLGCAGGRYHQF